jgi:hypothetical protein
MTSEGQVSIATHDNDGNAGTMWHSDVVPAAGQWIAWAFAAPANLRTIYYWNHNQNNLSNRGIQNVNIKISKDNGVTFTTLGDFVLIQASGQPGEKCQKLELPSTQTGVTNVKFDIATNFGGNVTGLSEIRFSDLPIVPPDPEATFTSVEGIVLNNDRVTHDPVPVDLVWTTANASPISIAPTVGTVDPQGDFEVTPPPGADTVYTLTAPGAVKTVTVPITVRTVVGGSSSFRYVRFTPTKLRDDTAANSIQIAEVQFYDADGAAVIPAGVTNPGGNNPGDQGPALVIDGLAGSKWLDFNKGPLVFDFGASPQAFVDYLFEAAGDAPERDPVRWILEGSNDQTAWTLIDNVTSFDYPFPEIRGGYTASIPLPGVSLQPYVSLVADTSVVVAGDPVTLTWQTQGAATVTIDQGIGTVAASGARRVTPAADTTYTLTATNSVGQSVTSSFSVRVVNYPIQTIAYANFNSSGDELSLIGSASVLSDALATADPTAAKRLRVNPDSASTIGAAWFRKRQSVGSGFDTTFGLNFINFTPDQFGGADGIAFVVQNSPQGSNAIGSNSQERGLASNALNITFDSYQNDDEESSATVQVRNGTTLLQQVDLSTFPGITLTKAGDLTQPSASAAPYQVHVAYVPGDLDIYVNGVLVVDSLAVTLDSIGAVDGSGTAYVGFTGRTGAAYESHDVTSWTLTSGGTVVSTPLKLTGYAINSTAGTVSLAWASTTGKSYRIAGSANLSTWTTLKPAIAADVSGSTASSTSFTPGAVRFFRVEEE